MLNIMNLLIRMGYLNRSLNSESLRLQKLKRDHKYKGQRNHIYLLI